MWGILCLQCNRRQAFLFKWKYHFRAVQSRLSGAQEGESWSNPQSTDCYKEDKAHSPVTLFFSYISLPLPPSSSSCPHSFPPSSARMWATNSCLTSPVVKYSKGRGSLTCICCFTCNSGRWPISCWLPVNTCEVFRVMESTDWAGNAPFTCLLSEDQRWRLGDVFLLSRTPRSQDHSQKYLTSWPVCIQCWAQGCDAVWTLRWQSPL